MFRGRLRGCVWLTAAVVVAVIAAALAYVIMRRCGDGGFGNEPVAQPAGMVVAPQALPARPQSPAENPDTMKNTLHLTLGGAISATETQLGNWRRPLSTPVS